MAKQIDIQADFGELASVLGTVQGAAKVLDDNKFLDLLITRAHAEASVQFDGDAAVYAAATGTLGHMYEWGTAGINTGRTTRRMDPLSSGAKLWRHKLTGFGATKEISFVFQPSVVPIPKPTVSKTGVPKAELNKLTGGPYVFTGKAAIMEAGTTVTIRPRGNNMLFVPFGNEASKNPDARRRGRNFIFTRGPINTIPGKNYAGNFSKYWLVWWNTEGERIMTESIQNAVEHKMKTLLDSAGRKMGHRPQRMSARQFKLDVSKARALAEREMYGGLDTP